MPTAVLSPMPSLAEMIQDSLPSIPQQGLSRSPPAELSIMNPTTLTHSPSLPAQQTAELPTQPSSPSTSAMLISMLHQSTTSAAMSLKTILRASPSLISMMTTALIQTTTEMPSHMASRQTEIQMDHSPLMTPKVISPSPTEQHLTLKPNKVTPLPS